MLTSPPSHVAVASSSPSLAPSVTIVMLPYHTRALRPQVYGAQERRHNRKRYNGVLRKFPYRVAQRDRRSGEVLLDAEWMPCDIIRFHADGRVDITCQDGRSGLKIDPEFVCRNRRRHAQPSFPAPSQDISILGTTVCTSKHMANTTKPTVSSPLEYYPSPASHARTCAHTTHVHGPVAVCHCSGVPFLPMSLDHHLPAAVLCTHNSGPSFAWPTDELNTIRFCVPLTSKQSSHIQAHMGGHHRSQTQGCL